MLAPVAALYPIMGTNVHALNIRVPSAKPSSVPPQAEGGKTPAVPRGQAPLSPRQVVAALGPNLEDAPERFEIPTDR